MSHSTERKLLQDLSLDGGLTATRLRKVLTRPGWALRNARYHWIRTVSQARHIFVVGPPRSGTTLVQNILRAHPRIAGLDGETGFFFRWNILDLRYPEIDRETMASALGSSRDIIEVFDSLADIVKHQNNADFFVEKTPEHALKIDFLCKRFPRSKIVFVVRDPRDGYLSAKRNPRVQVGNIPLYARLWHQSVSKLNATNSRTIASVRYEDLCKDPGRSIERIMTFLEIEPSPDQSDPGKYSSTSIRHKKGHERLGETISDRTVGQWRTQLSSDEIALFDRMLAEDMAAMGYGPGRERKAGP